MRISDAESAVMEILWARHPLGSDEVIAALAGTHDWHESTVKTLLGRLLRKGAIRTARDGRRYLYSPLLTREAWVSSESRGLLDRLFDGRVAPLVAHFSAHHKLTAEDIAALRKLIEEMDP